MRGHCWTHTYNRVTQRRDWVWARRRSHAPVVVAKLMKQPLRQRHLPMLSAFGPADLEHAPAAVDVLDDHLHPPPARFGDP